MSYNHTQLNELKKEDDDKLTDEICQTDAEKCVERLLYLENQNIPEISASEMDLVEMHFVTEGSVEGNVASVSESYLTFSFDALPAGTYNVLVNVKGGVGTAVSYLGQLVSLMELSEVIPSSGSIHGGQTIKISGGGFSGNLEDTSVSIGSAD